MILTLQTDIRDYIETIIQLPPMPQMAAEIVSLSKENSPNAADLARIIERDPSLTAQVLRYANSPLYAYQGKIRSVKEAIARVLGFELVMNMALGLSLNTCFRIPKSGPLGLDAFWLHAIYGAVLAERLCKKIPAPQRPEPGTAYLGGLLHDIGFLVIGHHFNNEYRKLCRAMADDEALSVTDVEQAILGVTHMEIGAWLIQKWQLPEEIVAVIEHHHDTQYRGKHRVLVALVQTADRLAVPYDVHTQGYSRVPEPVLHTLGLGIDEVLDAYKAFVMSWNELDDMARQLAA
jgi:putative nucleotidyltransferase with HDIG domain